MKKKFKRIASFVLAAVMVFAMAVPGMASEAADKGYTNVTEHKIVITSTPGHTYQAYQIFAGDVAHENGKEDNEGYILSNITWGLGVNVKADGFAQAISTVLEISEENAEDAQKVADALEKITANAEKSRKFAEAIEPYLTYPSVTQTSHSAGIEEGTVTYTLGVSPGYYLIKDLDGSQNKKDGVYTSFILEVVGDRTVKAKSSSTPKVEKEALDDGEWKKLVDQEINKTFQFKLTAEIPADPQFAQYDSYTLKFNDTLSKGVTYDGNETVTIKYNNGTEDKTVPVPKKGR